MQRKRQLEEEEIERKCEKLIAAGKCTVKGDPLILEFINSEGRIQKLRINFLYSYPKKFFEDY